MRELNGHKVNGLNEALRISVLDEPGSGGACHHYKIEPTDREVRNPVEIRFQNGPILEAGVNGVTHEALLAIIEDRLECFQAGPYAHKYNAEALEHVRGAQGALAKRTLERMDRGVEGTMVV
jgi:hypothetical protein